jgi:protein involved in polysaccharide export with SLBB domain
MSTSRTLLALLLLFVTATLIGCGAVASQQRTVGFVPPPREEVRAAAATERIQISDVLQCRLPDDSTATVNAVYQVASDGTIEVSGSGRVQVAGKTMQEAQQAVRAAVAVSAAAHEAIEIERSEYYLVAVSADGVKKVTHVPLKGHVTVKDAMKDIPRPSSKIIWITRTMPGQSVKEQVLPVDWEGISRGQSGAFNYGLQPGDFLFVADEPAKGVGRVFSAVANLFAPVDPPPPPNPQRQRSG